MSYNTQLLGNLRIVPKLELIDLDAFTRAMEAEHEKRPEGDFFLEIVNGEWIEQEDQTNFESQEVLAWVAYLLDVVLPPLERTLEGAFLGRGEQQEDVWALAISDGVAWRFRMSPGNWDFFVEEGAGKPTIVLHIRGEPVSGSSESA